MKQPLDLARRFLALADRDLRAFERLASAPEIDDEIVGFHAQQTAEKCLKAVLVRNGVEFRKVHDLELLLELLAANGIAQPPEAEAIRQLNPFAVVLRYDFLGEQTLDRTGVPRVLRAVRHWAWEQVGG